MDETTGKVLVVDDNELDCDMLRLGLEAQGHRVGVARDGREALERIEKEDFDLILLDVIMPRLSGLEVLKRIRRTRSVTDLPVILITARDKSEQVVEALELGANDYLTKPFDIPVVLARIRTQLRLHSMEEALKAQKDFCEDLIQSGSEMIIAVDMERRITLFNKAAEKSFGYSAEEVLGRPVSMLYADPEQGRQVHDHTVRDSAAVGEILNRKKNGEIFPSLLRASVLRDKRGKPIGLMGLSLDISEQKRLEAEREHLAQLKDRFIAIASHDVKHPLTVIAGGVAFVRELIPPGKTMSDHADQMLERVSRNVTVMQDIIADFLDFHALKDGRLALERVPSDLNDVALQVVDNAADYASSRKMQLVFEPEPALPEVNIDPARVSQVVRNYVSNAIKFSPSGSRVVVRTRQEADKVVLEVSDHGPGLMEEDLEKVFVEYAVLSNRPTGGEKSSGLGLAICRMMIDLHGGEVGAHNNPEGGATFWFRLPAG